MIALNAGLCGVVSVFLRLREQRNPPYGLVTLAWWLPIARASS